MKHYFLGFLLVMTSSLYAQTQDKFLSVGQRYIELLEKLSRDELIDKDIVFLFSPFLKKTTNSQLICQGLVDYQAQIMHFHVTENLKQIELLEILKTEKGEIVRFEITYADGTIDTVISILTCDQQRKIKEINQVYGAKGAYSWPSKGSVNMTPLFNFTLFKESNIPLLYEWLAHDHVAAWWRETRDYQKFYEKYKGRIEDNTIGCYFICHNNKPIGYIAWYDATNCPIRSQNYPEKGVYGFDVLIADTDYIGKGNGTKILQQFIDEIMMPLKPTKITVDPEVANERAIHVYEKLGFKKVKEVEATDGVDMVPAILMELIV